MLDVALKEWAIVCDLLAAGRVCLLLRKGGVSEFDGPGRFRLEHGRFAMFPAWEHERLDWVKPGLLEGMRTTAVTQEPAEIAIGCVAEVAGIWEVGSREAFDELDDLHAWTGEQIDMRFGYKPQRPLYAMALRVKRLAAAKVLSNREAFGGCVSWVPLEGAGEAVDARGGVLAREAAAFAGKVARVVGGWGEHRESGQCKV